MNPHSIMVFVVAGVLLIVNSYAEVSALVNNFAGTYAIGTAIGTAWGYHRYG